VVAGAAVTFVFFLVVVFFGLIATFDTAFAVFELVTIEVVSNPATPAMTFLRETIRVSYWGIGLTL
jgi:hypothetical protein